MTSTDVRPHEPSTDAAAPLTTGWEPGTAEGDTMLRRYLLHNASLTSAIARAAAGTVHLTDEIVVADLGRPSGYWNAATLLAPPRDWSATMDEVERSFAGGRGTAVLWSAWPTPDLRDRGWALSGHPPLLLRPPAEVVPPTDAPGSDGTELVRLDSESALATWERVAVGAYPLDELADEPPGGVAPAALLDDARFEFWTGTDDGVAVSSAMSFVAHDLVSLAFGATLAEHRHRGHWRRAAVQRLRSHPSLWGAGVFSDFSRPGAEQLGFVPVTRFTLWMRERP